MEILDLKGQLKEVYGLDLTAEAPMKVSFDAILKKNVGGPQDAAKYAAGLVAFKQADYAGLPHAALHLQPKRPQSLGNDAAGAGFLKAKLGMLVKIAPGCDHTVVESYGDLAKVRWGHLATVRER